MTKSKTWIIGDIHGEYDKLVHILKLVNFDYDNDTLIQLGDVVDRGPNSYKCIEELLKIKNLIAIKGNHDETFRESIYSGINTLYSQGGRETMLSYQREYPECNNDPSKIPFEHIQFFQKQQVYYVDDNNNLFVHAGIDVTLPIEQQNLSTCIWDREMLTDYLKDETIKNDFNKIFIGHTPTIYWNDQQGKPVTIPMRVANIINLDTGCGKLKNAPLTAMNLDTEEYFQVNDIKK